LLKGLIYLVRSFNFVGGVSSNLQHETKTFNTAMGEWQRQAIIRVLSLERVFGRICWRVVSTPNNQVEPTGWDSAGF
jgi:hypothetical protein